jgi:hypothetical protein
LSGSVGGSFSFFNNFVAKIRNLVDNVTQKSQKSQNFLNTNHTNLTNALVADLKENQETPGLSASKTVTCGCLMVEHPPEERAEKTPTGSDNLAQGLAPV